MRTETFYHVDTKEKIGVMSKRDLKEPGRYYILTVEDHSRYTIDLFEITDTKVRLTKEIASSNSPIPLWLYHAIPGHARDALFNAVEEE